jgi:hypothetical protein
MISFVLSSILLGNNKALAQEVFYKPDSIILFKFNNGDTSKKIAEHKITYKYDKDFNVTEKHNYHWSLSNFSWKYISKSTFSYFKKDIVEDVYTIEVNYPQFIYKKVYTFNSLTRPLEITKEIRPKTEIVILEKDLYTYEKDTLQKIESFKKSTTFFKNKETVFSVGKNKITKTETFLSELNGISHKKIQKQTFKNNHLIQTEISSTSKLDSTFVISNYYSKDSLLQSDTLSFTQEKVKNNLAVVNYMYDSTKHLQYEITYFLDKKGKKDTSKEGKMKVYYYHKNSPIIKGSFSDYIIQ